MTCPAEDTHCELLSKLTAGRRGSPIGEPRRISRFCTISPDCPKT